MRATALVALLATANTPVRAVEPAQTENGAFFDASFTLTLGPVINFFAPVENMVTPEQYFEIVGITWEKIDDTTYRIFPGEYKTLAQSYQLCQEHDVFTVNPPIESLQLERIFHPEITGPPYQLKRLWNYSLRAEVKNGESIAVGGLIVPGRHPKIVAIRALGPSLADFGVENALEDPKIEIFRNNRGVRADPRELLPPHTKILENDDYTSSYVSTDELLTWINVPKPGNDKDSLVVTILDPGIYSTHLSSVTGSSGVGLLEFFIYDAVDVVNSAPSQ